MTNKSVMPQYEKVNDEQLALFAQIEDERAQEELFARYKNLVKSKARTYFLVGADREDIIQEGMIGLYKAMRDYNSERLCSFRTFAELCITRQIITAIKSATCKKHMPLNCYVSLNKPVYDEEYERTLIDVLVSTKVVNPEELMIGRESYRDVEEKIGSTLSKLEQTVLKSYLSGKTYIEISKELQIQTKSIDNALQRVKKKLEKVLDNKQ